MKTVLTITLLFIAVCGIRAQDTKSLLAEVSNKVRSYET